GASVFYPPPPGSRAGGVKEKKGGFFFFYKGKFLPNNWRRISPFSPPGRKGKKTPSGGPGFWGFFF
ncbi:hypothetical protein, partial [Caldanaerobacter subterraneus]|uniref:hypothetical protein n=1 Tax=Caldanaerobacter subterraneus TaxID=911092 RepID=UPI00061833DD